MDETIISQIENGIKNDRPFSEIAYELNLTPTSLGDLIRSDPSYLARIITAYVHCANNLERKAESLLEDSIKSDIKTVDGQMVKQLASSKQMRASRKWQQAAELRELAEQKACPRYRLSDVMAGQLQAYGIID
jgi:hypothetical protein